jgi:hypothetical protein
MIGIKNRFGFRNAYSMLRVLKVRSSIRAAGGEISCFPQGVMVIGLQPQILSIADFGLAWGFPDLDAGVRKYCGQSAVQQRSEICGPCFAVGEAKGCHDISDRPPQCGALAARNTAATGVASYAPPVDAARRNDLAWRKAGRWQN